MSLFLQSYSLLLIYTLLQSTVHIAANIINAETNQYKNTKITCNQNEACTINCQQPHSCEHATIQCPINNKCIITCSAEYSCQDITINATYSSLLILNDCDHGNQYTCSGLSIYFPPNNNGKSRGILDVGNNFNSFSNTLQFYAINGWIDINTTLYTGNFQNNIQDGILYCSSNYNQQCTFDPKQWQCVDTNHICNNYTSPDKHNVDTPNSQNFNKIMVTISTLNEIWYIIGAMVMFLCCFLSVLLCLIHRSYIVHNEASEGLKVAETELKEFKGMHEILVFDGVNFAGVAGVNSTNSAKSFSMPSGVSPATPIPKSKPCSTVSRSAANILAEQSQNTLTDDKHSSDHKSSKKQRIKGKKNMKKYPAVPNKLGIDEWDPVTPANSVQKLTPPPSRVDSRQKYIVPMFHHNPPSIQSISSINHPHSRELGLQLSQINKLLARAPHHSPSQSLNTEANTLTTFKTMNTHQTFMMIESVAEQEQDEFIEYQHVQAPSSLLYKSSNESGQIQVNKYKSTGTLQRSGNSSTMPISVNSPSPSTSESSVNIGPAHHNNLINNQHTQQKLKYRKANVAHIPRFDHKMNKYHDATLPLPETHAADDAINAIYDITAVYDNRKDSAETASSNPFADTASSKHGSVSHTNHHSASTSSSSSSSSSSMSRSSSSSSNSNSSSNSISSSCSCTHSMCEHEEKKVVYETKGNNNDDDDASSSSSNDMEDHDTQTVVYRGKKINKDYKPVGMDEEEDEDNGKDIQETERTQLKKNASIK